jgi:hypothetical protein
MRKYLLVEQSREQDDSGFGDEEVAAFMFQYEQGGETIYEIF